MPLPPVPIGDIEAALERELGRAGWQIHLVAASSNYVYRCEARERIVALRTPRVDLGAPSSYWRQMGEVFGLTFPPTATQLATVIAAVSAAADGPACPQLLAATTVDDRPIFITTWIAGESWEPDAFPKRADVHHGLGRFLARLHERSQAGFGPVGGRLKPTSAYCEAAITSARTTIETAWTGDGSRLLAAMTAADPARIATTCALVMPDISANQFLFDGTGLAAVVDLDSYVIGPIELELTIAEWCLTDHGAFADGYRSVRPLPRFEPFRAFHRASMMVNEEAMAGDADRLFEENASFD